MIYDDLSPEVAAAMRERARRWRTLEMCANCPFRTDGAAVALAHGRLDEIKRALIARGEESTFYCHKSVYRPGRPVGDEDEDGTPTPRPGDLMCSGAAEYQRERGCTSSYQQVMERLDMAAVLAALADD